VGVCLPAYASEFYKLNDSERTVLAAEAVRLLRGRLPVIAQANHPAARQVAATVLELERAGATAINVAVPRLFPIPERDLFRYFDTVLSAARLPLIIQDFNPGGASISPEFIRDLHRAHPHFRYVKLEEPMMAAKVRAIRDVTCGEVGVLEGWGGAYMLELAEEGISGVMPGLGVADLLAVVFRLARERRRDEAYEIFQGVLPQIVFSLQSIELYHHAEKLLLNARGLLDTTVVRDAGITLSDGDRRHIAFLNSRILALLDRLGLPH
jgi:4-hydroxy-tetrahydrodipicolinate synthase